MKKIISFLLVACLALSMTAMLASCGDDEHTDDEGKITEEKWEEITSAPKFVNYTLLQEATVTVAGQGAYAQTATIKFTEGKAQISMKIDQMPEPVVLDYVGAEAEQQRKSYETVFLALLDDFDNFVYDAESKSYKNPNAVNTTITMTEDGETITAAISMTGGEVTLDADGNVAKFTCSFSQTTTVSGETITATTDKMSWTFSNYGTTVIETAAE